MIHPRVKKFITESGEKERIIKHLKKLKGKKHDMYRLRLGDFRFEYFIDEGKVWIDNAFKREKGYR